jgi:hypothetical protein
LAAIGQLASAVFAFAGLGFIGLQIRAARKNADLQSLVDYVRAVSELERELASATTDDGRLRAFFELANFLEIQAAALNGGLYPAVTRGIVREKLRDSVVEIEEAQTWHPHLQAAVSTPTTFEHLGRFMRRERNAIDALRRQRASPQQA